jgi:hypothetical protein
MPPRSRKLAVDDIADLRAYERERDEFRAHVVALKKRRRVAVGPFLTVLFENRDTIRFQVQEMGRVERHLTDAAVQAELDIYNPLIPDPGQLSATLFVELRTEAELREWLPRLVGIEQSMRLRFADGTFASSVAEEHHASRLTRDEVTPSVHYIRFELSTGQVDALAAGPVVLAADHPSYRHEVTLGEATVAELLADARP